MWKVAIALLLLLGATTARAETWFEFEAGAGIAIGQDSGDGQWVQYGEPHKVNTTVPAFEVGFTGNLYGAGSWGVDYHLDLVYISRMSVWSMAVPDVDYNQFTHKVISYKDGQASFASSGDEFGILATLAPYYVWDGWKFSVNGGAYAFRQTWSGTAYSPTGLAVFAHNPTVQLTWTAGISVAKGPWSVTYQYLPDRASWNPFPGYVEKTHLITVKYTF